MANEMLFEEAKQRYNRMMNDFCLEYLTIGTRFSEGTDDWNIRDMVSECQYQLDVCFEDGNANSDGRYIEEYMRMYSADYEAAYNEHRHWKSKTMKLRNFIKKYKEAALQMACTTGHSSLFDTNKYLF